MIQIFSLLLTVALIYADSPITCTDNVEPVCGSDGKLYYNECDLHARNTDSDVSVGDWDDCAAHCAGPEYMTCTREYMPHCGSNGVIYGNRCVLKYASCGQPAPILQEPLENCIDKLCPDTCEAEADDADCKASVSDCRRKWEWPINIPDVENPLEET